MKHYSIKEKTLQSVRDTWERLYRSNDRLTPYSSYEFASLYRKGLHFSTVRRSAKEEIYEIYDENNAVVAIVPLIRIGRNYYIYGDLCATGYLDFIYKSGTTDEAFSEIFELLFEMLGLSHGNVLHLNKLRADSAMCQYLLKHYLPQSETKCVAISYGDNYESYFKSLSKHLRQNVRTARNRLEREGHTTSFTMKIDFKADKELKRSFMEVYNERMGEKGTKGIEKSTIHSLKAKIVHIARNFRNPITMSTFNMKNNVLAGFYIDGKLAAMMAGYLWKDTIIVPRLAINSDFYVYCAGSLLVVEAIEYLTANTDVRTLDLSRGDEDYKYVLGGQDHFCYSFSLGE